MKRLTDEAWADIARAYAAGDETVVAIAARHGIDKNDQPPSSGPGGMLV